ncbi:MAG TPA: type II secretion system F family protein [Fontimonas sp.]
MSLFVVFGIAVLLAAVAVWLFAHANLREHEEEVLLRLRATGSEPTVAGGRLDSTQIRNPLLRWACHQVWRTGVELSQAAVGRILLAIIVLVVLAIALLGLFAGVSTAAVLLTLGWAWINHVADRRRALIVSQLPGFLEGVIRILGAGNTLDEAISSSAREAQHPIQPLFLSVGRQVRLGAPIESVLIETAEIHRLPDLKVMALAAAINRKYGGSLRNVLRSLIHAVRSRDTAARELRALTAETRFSAVVLSIIPAGLMLYIFAQNPSYYQVMWADGTGRWLLIFSVCMQLFGVFWIYRMMRSTGDGT